MFGFVLDCSVTISWLIPDERDDSTLKILEMLPEKGSIVPSIWPLEVGNVLLVAQRHKRIASEQRHSAIYALNQLPIKIDTLTSKNAFLETMELAELHNLTSYDASYLELAIRMNLPIATLDKKLIQVAKERKVSILK